MPLPNLVVRASLLLLLAPTASAQTGRFHSPARRLPYQVYYTEGGSNPLDLGWTTLRPQPSVETLATGEGVLGRRGMALDAENCHLYVAEGSSDHEILRFNTDGSGRTVILDYATAVKPEGVALDAVGGRLYIISPFVATRIRSCKLDGSDTRDLVGHIGIPGGVSPDSIHFDPATRRFYWWDTIFEGFRVGLLDANDDVACLKNLYQTGTAASYDVDLVNGHLYWAVNQQGGGGTIFRTPIPPDAVDPCDASSCDTTTCPPESFVVDTATFSPLDLSVFAENAPGEAEKGVLVWGTGNNTLRWRSLKGTWPVPIHQADLPVSAGNMIGLEVGSGVTMCAAGAAPDDGKRPVARLAVSIEGGDSGAPFVLRLTELDGSPLEVRLGVGRLDEAGSRSLEVPVPSSLSGRSARLEAAILDGGLGGGLRRSTTARLP